MIARDEIHVGAKLRGRNFADACYVEVLHLGNSRFLGQFHTAAGPNGPEAAYDYGFGWERYPAPPPRLDVDLDLALLDEEITVMLRDSNSPVRPRQVLLELQLLVRALQADRAERR